MLVALDIFLTVLHLSIIGFNLLGWIWPATRRAHLVLVALTAGSWLILGIWYGTGYCPVTDWQWQVKRQLGVRELPPSFNTWFVQKITGHRFPDALVNNVTAIAFAAAALLAIYFNFIHPRIAGRRTNASI